MSTAVETSDEKLLDLLRTQGPLTVTQLASSMSVTATAVRQRLSRLMGQGLVQREVARPSRGRPGHHYSLTKEARRRAGTNFADLAVALWKELRAVEDPVVRRGLLQRVARALAESYLPHIKGETTAERMQSIGELMTERRVPFEVDSSGGLPVLTARDCPYPELAEEDRSICAVERLLFSELIEQDVKLSQCRLDGHSCCQFQTN